MAGRVPTVAGAAVVVILVLVAALGARANPADVCRNSSIGLQSIENDHRTSVIDSGRGFLYIPVFSQSRVVRVSLDPYERVDATSTAPHKQFLSSAIDVAGGHAYFGTGTTATVVRVNLDTWAMDGTLNLYQNFSYTPENAAIFTTAMIDTGAGFVYFGEIDGALMKIRTSDFTFVNELTLPATQVQCSFVDVGAGFGYVATLNGGSGAKIVKVDLTDFSVEDTLFFAEYSFYTALHDPTAGNAVFSSDINGTAAVVRVDLSTFTVTDVTPLLADDLKIVSGVMDPDTGTAYYGTDQTGDSPLDFRSYVIALETRGPGAMVRKGNILMDVGETRLASASTASVGGEGFAYFGTRGSARVIRMQFPAVACGDRTDCASCALGCSCGWCAATQTCLGGDRRGDFDATCTGEDWDYGECPECATRGANCTECAGEPKCGWCSTTEACRRGTEAGPYDPDGLHGGACAVWDDDTCHDCDLIDECGACASAGGCGWCAATQTCSRGDAGGSFTASCPAINWSNATCPDCGAHAGDCDACAADDACGWCAVSGTCVEGNGDDPFVGTCSDYTYDFCPTCDATECGDCVGSTYCGWCGTSGSCERGNATTAHLVGCLDDAWDYDQCYACAHADCAACSADDACGWCAVTQTCLRGGETGHYTDAPACPVWQYNTTCPTCDEYTVCNDCVGDGRCGWCEAAQECAEGDATDQFVDTCAAGWNFGSCSDCDYADCDACTADTACGWCATTQACSAGNDVGPYNGLCADWDRDCPDCGDRPDAGDDFDDQCGTCTADAKCGFCGASQTCVRSNGTAALEGVCAGAALDTGSAACGLCEAIDSCGNCTATDGCGWCASTNTCHRGDDSDAFDVTCAAWRPDTCAACVGLTCTGCTSEAGCGWCGATGSCFEGESDGPLIGNCSAAWDFGSCDALCGAFSASSGCDDCVGATSGGCAFCAATRTCLPSLTSACPSGAGDTLTTSDQCAACSTHTSCDACAASPLCGWCPTEGTTDGTCTDANPSGPLSAEDACDGFSYSTCEDQTINDECGAFDSCKACAGEEACGWCRDSDSCVTVAGATCADVDEKYTHCKSFLTLMIILGCVLLCLVFLIAIIVYFCCCRTEKATDPTSEDVELAPHPDMVPASGSHDSVVEMALSHEQNLHAPRHANDADAIELMPLPYKKLLARDSDITDDIRETLAALEMILIRGDQFLVSALCRVANLAQYGRPMARAMVCDFEANHLSADAIKVQINEEVEHTLQANTLFRTDSMPSKMLREYSMIVGVEFLYRLLRPAIDALAEVDHELADPRRRPTEDGAEVAELLAWVDVFFKRITNSVDAYPPELRAIYRHIYRTVTAKFPAMGVHSLASFVILRLVNPAILSPGEFGIWFTDVPYPLNKNLIAVSKLILMIANNKPFQADQSHLANCNAYIQASIKVLSTFLLALVDEEPGSDGLDVAAGAGGGGGGGALVLPVTAAMMPPGDGTRAPNGMRLREVAEAIHTPDATPAHVRDEALFELAQIVVHYLEDLRVEMGAVQEPEYEVRRRKPFDLLQNEVLSDQPNYPYFLEMLLAENLAAVSALCDVTPRDGHRSLALALARLFTAHNADLRLVITVTARELRSAVVPNNVLRGIHLAAHLLSCHSSMVGASYRAQVVGPVVGMVCADPHKYEVDPGRIRYDLDPQQNLVNILEATSSFLEAVFNSLDRCPLQFRTIADHLTRTVGERFFEEWYLGPGRYFFQRFMCEALVAPEKCGVADVPSKEAKRALSLIHRIVMNLVTGMQFGVEHAYMKVLNEFIDNNREVMREFLMELSRVPEGAPHPLAPAVHVRDEEEALLYIREQFGFYIDNADFCYFYHFYHYYHTDASDDDEAYEAALEPPPLAPEAQTFFETASLVGTAAMADAAADGLAGGGESPDRRSARSASQHRSFGGGR